MPHDPSLADIAPEDTHPKSPRIAGRERKRVARACTSCRRQKEKCTGGFPCRRCARFGRNCEFVDIGSSLSMDYLKRNQRENDAAQNQIAELTERLTLMEKILTRRLGVSSFDIASLRNLANTASHDDVDDLSTGQSNLHTHEIGDLDGEDFKEKITVKDLGHNITHYSGEFSHWNFSMTILERIASCSPPNYQEIPHVPDLIEHHRAEELQSPSGPLPVLATLPPRHIADFLVRVFFKNAQTNYFLIEEAWLLSKLDILYTDTHRITHRDVSTVCIVFALLAIGTQYAYLDELSENGESQNLAPDSTSTFSEDSIGVMFYQQACKLVPDVIAISSLESVQACLLIGMYALPLDASGLAYTYLSLAMKLAVQNGMHRRCPDHGLDASAFKVRNLVWWTVYTMERSGCPSRRISARKKVLTVDIPYRRLEVFHGRPLSISMSEIDADMPVEQQDANLSPRGIKPALSTLHLHKMLATIAGQVSMLRKPQEQNIDTIVDRLVKLNGRLRDWWERLSEAATGDRHTLNSNTSRPEAHLKLEYCLVRMFMGRLFIFDQMSTSSHASASSAPGSQLLRGVGSTTPKMSARSILINDCIEAAITVVDTCKMLQSSIGLARASYTEFTACRAALLVLVAMCLQNKTEELQDYLKQGLTMMKFMSAGGESARSDTSLIEIFHPSLHTSLDHTIASGEDNDYSRFKDWENLCNGAVPGSGMSATSEPGIGTSSPLNAMLGLEPMTDMTWMSQSIDFESHLPATPPATDWSMAKFVEQKPRIAGRNTGEKELRLELWGGFIPRGIN
ncbi:unnamed protein product [Clonostachys solani]|uniref:Zn(2)-C6 fungal-type domain-containing protein n=1 Tax=Clonostachys solani TaxID=160281 RepID=A0A9N9Z9L8_9HYPO|nr:unnamed protein product [Clonostachys solani]